VDTVIVSVGVSPNPLIPRSMKELDVSSWGTIKVNKDSLQSSVSGIFAGGDIVRGGATVILAMGDGRKAAAGMNKYIKEKVRNIISLVKEFKTIGDILDFATK
ncbi:MAG: FAD-dependent oxidoreductase, partial [Bacteroidetes bacterium]|nr:FAD-dependent oxidoreductase [Bacteroidota bacterium]